MDIRFYEQALDSDLKCAVVAARVGGKWLLCRHRGHETWELPGGLREAGEDIYTTARRELQEGIGAIDFQLEAVSAYGVFKQGEDPAFGALFFADIRELAECPASSKVEETCLTEEIPAAMAYPDIHPALIEQVQVWLDGGNFRSEEENIFELMM